MDKKALVMLEIATENLEKGLPLLKDYKVSNQTSYDLFKENIEILKKYLKEIEG